jgi:hypothetical protein
MTNENRPSCYEGLFFFWERFGFGAPLYIFAISQVRVNIPSTRPFYGWLFEWTVPCDSVPIVQSNNSILQFALWIMVPTDNT